MDSDIGKKIKEAREKKGLSQRELADKIGVSEKTLRRYEKGTDITVGTLKKIADVCDVSFYELTGTKPLDQIVSPKIKKIASQGKMYISKTTRNNSIEVEVLSIRPGAGHGTELEAVDLFDTGERIVIDRSLLKTTPKGRLRAMQVDGYSMVPMLFPDSWVIIDETKEFRGDGLYVINVDNVLMVKLIEKNLATGNLWVKSINPDYDSWEIKNDDQRVFEIYGKVVRCII